MKIHKSETTAKTSDNGDDENSNNINHCQAFNTTIRGIMNVCGRCYFLRVQREAAEVLRVQREMLRLGGSATSAA